MRHYKLFYGSSYDIDLVGHKMYHIHYAKECRKARVYLLSVFQKVFGLSEQGKIRLGAGLQVSFLLKSLQKYLEQVGCWSLERKINSLLQKTKQKCERFSEWSMERWEENRQEWLCSYLETRTPTIRFSWICERTQIGHRTENWSLSQSWRGGASC